jgi:hypothetical protein
MPIERGKYGVYVLRLSRRQTADSRVGVWKRSDVSGTNTVRIFRVLFFPTRPSVLLLICSFTMQRL